MCESKCECKGESKFELKCKSMCESKFETKCESKWEWKGESKCESKCIQSVSKNANQNASLSVSQVFTKLNVDQIVINCRGSDHLMGLFVNFSEIRNYFLELALSLKSDKIHMNYAKKYQL